MLEWHVAEGDFVNEGDTVVEISTDKVDAEVPAPAAGVITKLIAQVDEEVPVGAPFLGRDGARRGRRGWWRDGCRVLTAPQGLPGGRGRRGGAAAPFSTPPPGQADGSAEGTAAGTGVGNGADGSSGDARGPSRCRRARCRPEGDEGSGPGSKVTKEDVLAASDGGASSPAASAGEAKALRGPAAMLASAMNESRAVPTATSFRTVAVDTLDAKRKALNGVLKERGMKVSFTHLVAWAIVQAAKDFPCDGPHLRGARGQAVRARGRAGQPRHRRRRRAQGRLPQPHGAGDQGRRRPRLRRLPFLLRGPDHLAPARASSAPTTSRAPTSR